MKPTYEEMLQGCTSWSKTHKGVRYEVKFHGYVSPESDALFGEGHKRIWCYYIYVPEQMYIHRWSEFRCGQGYGEHGSAFDKVWFDSSITCASNEPVFHEKVGVRYDVSKVGCDYNHLWNMEAGYPDTYESVCMDAIHTVESLLKEFPDYNLRCKWSGAWGPKEEFYESVGGWMVHKDSKVPDEYELWKPKE